MTQNRSKICLFNIIAQICIWILYKMQNKFLYSCDIQKWALKNLYFPFLKLRICSAGKCLKNATWILACLWHTNMSLLLSFIYLFFKLQSNPLISLISRLISLMACSFQILWDCISMLTESLRHKVYFETIVIPTWAQVGGYICPHGMFSLLHLFEGPFWRKWTRCELRCVHVHGFNQFCCLPFCQSILST